MMPMRKFTTATTAFTLRSVSACQSTSRPVTSQVRKLVAGAWAIVDMWLSSRLLHHDLADHGVVTDPAELVADDAEVSRLVGNDLEPVVVARDDLEVEVDRVQAETVVDVCRGEMERVAHAFLQPEHGIPAPHPGEEVDVAPRGRRDHRDAVVLADLVVVDELVHASREVGRIDPCAHARGVLAAAKMPERHHGEQDQAPDEGDAHPHLILLAGGQPPGSGRSADC